ncbi:hypothetical protein LPYR103PRE_07960 [Segatella asaccharophila]|jgi:hypothetical protein
MFNKSRFQEGSQKGKKMKKMILMAVALLSMTTATFAANDEKEATATAAAYNMNFNMNSLSNALGLEFDQEEAVEDVHHNFSAEMMNAAQAPKADRKTMVDKAINKDLRYMHSILSESQYHKYLQLLNVTLNNRGIEK